ncbi:MAG: hypothetical protein WEB87_04925, partial [Bacteriovoracaceae bacterium]
MFKIEELAQAQNIELRRVGDGFAVVDCSLTNLESTVFYLKNHMGFAFLCGINFDKTAQTTGALWYWLENIEIGFSLGIRVSCRVEEKLPSLGSIFKNAATMEAELAGGGDVKVEPKGVCAFNRDAAAPAWRNSVEAGEVDESFHNFGWLKKPLNSYGEQEFSAVSRDDIVLKCETSTGYYGNSIEEKLVLKNAPNVADHLLKYDGYDGVVWSGMFLRALEEANKIELPDKAQAIRMIFFELSRVLGHLEFVAQIAFHLKATSFYFKILRWTFQIEKLQTAYSGNMYNLGIFTLGGIHRAPPPHWISTCLKRLAQMQSELASETEKIVQNAFWRRIADVGVVSPKDLVEWGITGCALRASGINFDLRKRKPFYLYHEVDFETPIGINGSLFDRLLIRLQESSQSMGIISQLLDNLPTGELVSEDLGHFSHFKGLEIDSVEKEYRESVEQVPLLEDNECFCSMETSRGIAILFARTKNSKVERLYL